MKLYNELASPYPAGHAQRVGLSPAAIYLAERAIFTCDGAYLVQTQTGIWQHCKSRKAAQHLLEQSWIGGPMAITRGDIDKFLDCDVPVMNGAMKVPTSSAPVVQFMGRTYVNTWVDTVMKPDIDALYEPEVRHGLTLLLRMIREALCGKIGEKSLDEMVAIGNGDDPAELEFRVLMMWLAAPLQQIGRNLQINLWLIGETNGVGKGTLNSIMTQIYGADNCALLNVADLENRGWTDGLIGKLWVNINELNSVSNKLDYNSFLKQYTTEDWLTVTRRGVDAQQVINFANWMITSNKERPTCIDVADRRHFLVATTDDKSKVQLAVDLRTWMDEHPDQATRMLGAFVALLVLEQRIDETLLVRAAATQIKDEVQDATGEDADLEWWLINDERYPRDTWERATDLVVYFGQRFPDTSPRGRNPRLFGIRLRKLARKGKIESRKCGTASYEYRIDSDRYPVSAGYAPVTSKVVTLNLPKRIDE